MIRRIRRFFLFGALCLLLTPPALRIPLGFLPGEGRTMMAVTVEIKGAFPDTVESTITLPLEEELYELPGLENMRSVSQAEESRVLLLFDDDTDPEAAYLSVRQAVERASVRFPENAQRPRIDQSDPSARPVFVAAMPPTDVAELRRRYEQVDGVGTVSIGGGARRELHIIPDSRRLADSGSSIGALVRRLQDAAVVGSFHRANDPPLLFDSRPRRADEFGALLLAPGLPLSGLSEVAVSLSERESVSRINGRPTSVVSVTASGGANEVALCRRLRHLSESIPEGQILYDYGSSVEDALGEAALALGVGAAAVALLTFLFVGNFRSAGAVAGSIPFCALVSLSVLSVLRFELDVMSLAGIAVGVGLVVDGGIIYSAFSRQASEDQAVALTKARAPILLGAITTVVVFSPLIFASTPVYTRFAGLAIAIVSSVAASLFYVFGLLPALLTMRRHGADGEGAGKPAPRPGSGSRVREAPPAWFVRAYRSISGMRRRGLFAISIAAVAAPILLLSLSPKAGIALDDGLLRVTVEYAAATTRAAVEKDARRLEALLVSHPAVRRVTATFEKERARFEVDSADSQEVRAFLGAVAQEGYLSGFLFFPDESPEEVAIPVLLTARSQEEARSAAREVGRAAGTIPPVQGVIYHFKEDPDAAVVTIDLDEARFRGISPRSPAAALYWSMALPVAAKWRPPGDELDIRIRPPESAGRDILAEVFLPTEAPTPLGAVASLKLTPTVGRIDRDNRRDSARLSVLTGRREAPAVVASLREAVADLSPPRGTTIMVDPESADREAERGNLLLMGALSLFLVVATILAAFKSLSAMGFCLLQLPLSWLAPAVYLAATKSALTPAVALGLVVTTGVAVNNTILVLEALPEAGPIRALWHSLGPIAVASATTVAGVIPLAFVGAASMLGRVAIVLSLGTIGSVGALATSFPGRYPAARA